MAMTRLIPEKFGRTARQPYKLLSVIYHPINNKSTAFLIKTNYNRTSFCYLSNYCILIIRHSECCRNILFLSFFADAELLCGFLVRPLHLVVPLPARSLEAASYNQHSVKVGSKFGSNHFQCLPKHQKSPIESGFFVSQFFNYLEDEEFHPCSLSASYHTVHSLILQGSSGSFALSVPYLYAVNLGQILGQSLGHNTACTFFISLAFISSRTSQYRSIVIARVLCPKMTCNVFGCIPASMQRVAKQCRKV